MVFADCTSIWWRVSEGSTEKPGPKVERYWHGTSMSSTTRQAQADGRLQATYFFCLQFVHENRILFLFFCSEIEDNSGPDEAGGGEISPGRYP
jgi:hypothetical protein